MGSGKGRAKRVSNTAAYHPLDKEVKYKVNDTFVNIDYTNQGKTGRVSVKSKNISMTGIMCKDENNRWAITEPGIHLCTAGNKKSIYFDNANELFDTATHWTNGALYSDLRLKNEPYSIFYLKEDADHHLYMQLYILSEKADRIVNDLGEIQISEFKDMAKALVELNKSIMSLPSNGVLPQKPINGEINF